MQKDVDVDHRHLGVVEKVLVLGHDLFLEDLVDLGQQSDVKARVAVGAQKGHDQGLHGGVGGAIGVGGHARIDDVHAGLDGLEMTHGAHAGSKVAVQVNGCLDRGLEGLDQIIGVVGGDQAGHVLDADAVGAHGLQFLGLIDIIVQIVHFAAQARFGHGVADAALKVLAVRLDLGNDGLEIAVVVEGVEGPKDIHAVLAGTIHERIGHVIGVVAIAHQVLGAQQHGERGFLEVALQGADAFPGILVEKTVHGVEGGTPPGFHGPVAHLVHQLGHGDHVLGAPAGGKEALVAVAEAQIHDLHRVFRRRPVHIVVHCGHFDLIVITHRMGLL
ncbi:hypothetical protein DESC_720044 [Desulfosarcina cetonica]|nr:hypothetical protein DESC_720044 [Desulfosarcina cetonica]